LDKKSKNQFMLYRLSKVTKKPEVEDVELSSLEEAGWKEKDLENLLASRPQDLLREEKPLIISQETKWQEEADLLALDREGLLYIFELKRGASGEENLLQVIRYGQMFGQATFEDLQQRWRKYIGNNSSDLAMDHQRYFDLDQPIAHSAFNKNQRFVVITAGIDVATLQSVEYWRSKGLPIIPLTYHVYKNGSEYFVEFHAFSPQANDYAMLLSHCHAVNTNISHDPDAWNHMLTKNRASGFFGTKRTIDRIQKGDRVILYHKGVGAIAYGTALSGFQVDDYNGGKGEEHYVNVKWETKVDPLKSPAKAVAAWEINSHFKTGYTFRTTRLEIPKSIARFIGDKLKARATN